MLIDNILTSSDKQEIQFADAQWLYMNDNNNNGYSNYIQFLTTTLKNQFIDYHNAYFLIPMTIVIATSTLAFGYAPRPPMIAFRESVLSLFANITIATDQGQVLVNDINTMFINNLRLCVEHNYDWMDCEGSLLQFSYDRYQIQPNRFSQAAVNAAYPWNPNNSDYINYAYQAPQGTLMDALNFSPITNDPNTFGQYNLASSSTVTITTGVITSVARNWPHANPVTDNANLLAGTANGLTYSAYIPLYTPNGQTAYLHMTYTSTGAGPSSILEIGGINLTSGVSTGLIAAAGGTQFPGFASGLSALLTNAATQLLYLEAFATVSAFPTAIANLGTVSPVPAATPVPLSAFGGTCIVPIIVYVVGGTSVTLVQVGGLNLYTGYSNTSVGTAVATATGNIVGNLLVGSESMQANIGFKERVTHFQSQSVYQYSNATPLQNNTNAHMYSFSAQVPLKMIHDLFMQLDIPIINVGWNIQLFLAQTNGPFATAQYPPFMSSNNVLIQTGGQDDTPTPAIFYGNFKGSATPCRLYYRVVKFQPQDNSEMAKKLTAGFTKSFTFISTDWIIPQGGPITSNGGTSQIYLSQSVVHPLRLWALGYANNAAINQQGGVVTKPGAFIQSASYAPGVVTGLFNNVNVLVNNLPYFRQNMQNPHDLYEQLREQFNPDTGSMISYEDFANYKRTLCFDLTRISDRLQSPTEPVSLIFQGTRNDGLQYNLDMIFLVERKNQVTFRFSAADVAIVVGNLD